jgi:hypothetical protein
MVLGVGVWGTGSGGRGWGTRKGKGKGLPAFQTLEAGNMTSATWRPFFGIDTQVPSS